MRTHLKLEGHYLEHGRGGITVATTVGLGNGLRPRPGPRRRLSAGGSAVTATVTAVMTGFPDARTTTYEVSGAPLYRTSAGRLIAQTDLTVRVVDGQAELDLTGVQIDPRTLDPAQPEHRVGCRVPIELAPDWATAKIDDALGGRHV